MTAPGQKQPLVRVLYEAGLGEVPLPEIPEFPDALEALRKKYPPDESTRRALDAAAEDLTDPRVRAVFQVAPGAGALVTPESLAAAFFRRHLHGTRP